MGPLLHPEQVDRYRRQGALFPILVLTPAEVAAYRSALEELEELNGGVLKRLDNAHRYFPWAYHLATHDAVVDAVESVLGGDLLIDGSLILCKYPHDLSYVSWHQDSVYSNWHLSPTTSAWIALSPSTARSGCMRVVPGSHERGQVAHDEVRDGDNLLRRGERVVDDVDEAEAVDIELRPGEMSLHHSNIIHGSNPNRTDDKRIGFIVRFVTGALDRGDRPMLRVSGASDGRHLEWAGPPSEADPATALAAWRADARSRQPS
jgi:ectoine hydroxylase-related dioxygenase (phytanoyl-CoA dioxygenase family)